MKKILLLLFGILFFNSNAQNIQMEFPHFKGKAYDFIIFQGTNSKVITQDTIPPDGKFTLKIPKEYEFYTGMSRWLITGTKEGGGLDMLIPGHDFSVSSKEAQPNDDNTIYTGNQEIYDLNAFYKKKQEIFARHDAMLQATRAFSAEDKNYPIYEKEHQNQIKAYESLQNELTIKNNYPAQFINIVNITQGIGTRILQTEKEKAENIANYIARDLNWEILYTSGHWDGIIGSWVSIHTLVLEDVDRFAQDFSTISKKITDKKRYTEFVGRTTYYLTQQGKDEYITSITPMVVSSGKITGYDGVLSAYVKGTTGTQAPDLVLTNTTLKSSELAGKDYRKSLLLFYESACGHCEALLEQLAEHYENFKKQGLRIISISADKEEDVFKNKAKNFPWKEDAFCDYQGIKGSNFVSYAVSGTPTMILIDQSGKILLRASSLKELQDYMKKNK